MAILRFDEIGHRFPALVHRVWAARCKTAAHPQIVEARHNAFNLLQALPAKPGGPGGLFGNDDLRTRLAVFDERGFGESLDRERNQAEYEQKAYGSCFHKVFS